MATWLSVIKDFFSANQAVLITALLLLQILGLIYLVTLSIKTSGLRRRYNALLKDGDNSNLESVLLQIGERLNSVEGNCDQLTKSLDDHRQYSAYHIQRWALLRYKAFSNTGGDQSFSMAMLDDKGSGVVISSIYGRDESRVYAKSVQNGKSTYALSSEEEEVIKQALTSTK